VVGEPGHCPRRPILGLGATGLKASDEARHAAGYLNKTMDTTYYRAFRDDFKRAQVRRVSSRQERELAWRLDLANHSPTGGEWGYAGSGPAQLALALLADAFGGSRAGDQLALAFHQEFKRRVIAVLDQEAPWTISVRFIFEEISRLIVDDVEHAASRIQSHRDLIVTIDLNRAMDEAEARHGQLPSFEELEALYTGRVNEEFQGVLSTSLGMSGAFCARLLQPQ